MSINYKNTNAERTTVTRDSSDFSEKSGNIYKALIAISKRSNQISAEMKDELTKKLAEFASTTDNLEEIFENREQIEISKFYESLPKPVAIAIQEYLEDKIYVRDANEAIEAGQED
ncbi:DNA-directed RNA polymerase subunit omega [Paracrocinitomix mangrovi]|uniref:DNA-directed RNA polymerase subunit omega n=1 Tax=Paracrocinitomix mangrovi TaxID=2862509 RepID=UPI001C8DC55F|nr:DNA-directed RNA polymerase subunit omega [Paracrocinitomix mangrovi]UKN01275.1 DNA-directed RNA polymerase subunit omega [Paracrocinitomix mangrovi]